MASIESSHQSPDIVYKKIWVTSGETRVVEILERYLNEYPKITYLLDPIQRGNCTYHYVSGTISRTEKLQRSIKDSVAHRGLPSAVADIEDLQSKHKIIK